MTFWSKRWKITVKSRCGTETVTPSKPGSGHSYSGGGSSGGSSSVGSSSSSSTPSSKTTSRIAGENRYATVVKVSQAAYPNGAKTVILADSEKFSDVLAAIPYGSLIKAPVLYTNIDKLPGETQQELKRLGAEKVIIIGGEKTVSAQEQKALEGLGYKTDRINGSDRYETAGIIADRMKAAGAKGMDSVIIASGEKFPDALSISSLAVQNQTPILLSGKDRMSNYTIKALEAMKQGKVYISGGTNTVSATVESQLKKYTKQAITRYAGEDRYATSAAIAKALRPDAQTSVLASGEKFQDALVAGELVGKDNAPLMLLKKTNVPASVANYLKNSKVSKNVLVGGENTIANSVLNDLDKLESR